MGESFGIVWRSSWAGILADYGVGLTQVQGGKTDNVLNEKFLTPSLQWGRTNTIFCLGFQFVGVVGMVGDSFSLRVGAWRPEGMRHMVFHVE